jgi:hypothetical protein
LLQDDGFNQSLQSFSLSVFIGNFLGIDGRERDFQFVSLIVIPDLPLDPIPPFAVNIDPQILAILLIELITGAEFPFLV